MPAPWRSAMRPLQSPWQWKAPGCPRNIDIQLQSLPKECCTLYHGLQHASRVALRRNVHHHRATLAEYKWHRQGPLFSLHIRGIFSDRQSSQVIHTVSKFLNLLEERGLLLPEEEEQQSSASTSLDTRGKVAKEILDSERKYVQDLEVLQVSALVFPLSPFSRNRPDLPNRALNAFSRLLTLLMTSSFLLCRLYGPPSSCNKNRSTNGNAQKMAYYRKTRYTISF